MRESVSKMTVSPHPISSSTLWLRVVCKKLAYLRGRKAKAVSWP